MAASEIPSGFVIETFGPSRVVVDAARRDRMFAEGLARPSLLIAAARARGGGRGGTYEITIGGEDLILRIYRRGGIPRLLWKDRMFDDLRSQREVAALVAARARGVPSVEPVAAVATAAGLGFYRHYLVTVKLAGAVELLDFLNDPHRGRAERLAVLARAAGTVQKAFDSGIEPIDLHPRNLLITETPSLECYLVDLDGAVIQKGSLPPTVRAAALVRFVRFLERHADDGGRAMSRADVGRFIRMIEGDAWRRTHRDVRRAFLRTRWMHRIGWIWRPKSQSAAAITRAIIHSQKRGAPAPLQPKISFIFTARGRDGARATLDRIFESAETAGVRDFEIIGVAQDGRGLNDLRVLSLETPNLRFLAFAFEDDGGAWRAGIRAARGGRIVVTCSAALDARFLTEALDLTAGETDVVVGSRGAGAADARPSLIRARDRIRSFLFKLRTRVPVADPLSSFVAKRDDRFEAAMRAARSNHGVTAEIIGRLAEAGARIREAPVGT
ncbi:MAG: hypothetical protein HY286_16195 [Planctomycetes bacterium]|nr:hypothetical protein [Planctomycetota bacterium]